MYYLIMQFYPLGTISPSEAPYQRLGRLWYRYDSSTQFLELDFLTQPLPCSNMLKP